MPVLNSLTTAFETVDTVRASDVLTATLYQSAHHQVLDEVGVRQNSYVFRVDTGAQRFTVASKVLLEERVHENAVLAQAVAQFEARNKKLATELRGVLTVRTHDVVQILASPFSTAADLAGQLGRNVAKTLGEDPKNLTLLAKPVSIGKVIQSLRLIDVRWPASLNSTSTRAIPGCRSF